MIIHISLLSTYSVQEDASFHNNNRSMVKRFNHCKLLWNGVHAEKYSGQLVYMLAVFYKPRATVR